MFSIFKILELLLAFLCFILGKEEESKIFKFGSSRQTCLEAYFEAKGQQFSLLLGEVGLEKFEAELENEEKFLCLKST